MSETTRQTIVEQYKEQAKRDGTRIDELRQSTEHWHDTAQMLKRQRDTAEEERDSWKLRAMQSEQRRQALRVERDALRELAKMRAETAEAEAEAVREQRDYWAIAAHKLADAMKVDEALHATNTDLRDQLVLAEGQRDRAKQRAEAAEAERENVSSQLWDCTNERDGLRAECEAMRKVDDAMVGRAWQSLASVCGVVCYNEDGEYMPFHHINLVEREDVRFALTAALAVQPTTGEGA